MFSLPHQMYEVDYDNPMGHRKAPGSKQVGKPIRNQDMADTDDNYSYIPGKGNPQGGDPKVKKKFGLELYEEHPAPNSMMEAMKVSHQAKSRGKKVRFIRGKKWSSLLEVANEPHRNAANLNPLCYGKAGGLSR